MPQSDTLAPQTIGFGATSYIWGDKTVISYRGTDTGADADRNADIANGWIVGVGAIGDHQDTFKTTTQANYAEKYFELVAGGDAFGASRSDVILTGHSLGGGLAGYIASLNRTTAVIFDHMPFEAATILRYIDKLLRDGISAEDLLQLIEAESYLGFPDQSGVSAFNTTGEVLDFIRPFGTYAAIANTSILQLHPELSIAISA